MGHLVFVCYKPKPGKEEALVALLHEHVPILREQGLVTERTPVLARARNGTFVEVFEWVSAEAVERAHHHPVVLGLWERFGAVCEYGTLGELPEAGDLFAHFTPVSGDAPLSAGPR